MGIQIQSKQDYSMLFNSMGGSKGSSNMLGINLSDYSAIKSGSYGKLMKAYYGRNKTSDSEEVSQLADQKNTFGASSDSAKVNQSLQSSAGKLSSATDALSSTQKDAVLSGTDEEAKQKAVQSFVDEYNGMIDASKQSNNKNVLSTVSSMTDLAKVYQKSLNGIGITIGEDKKLSFDKETFAKADTQKVTNVFQGAGSFGYGVSLKASMVNVYAKSDAAKQSGLYGNNAKYDATMLAGNTFTDLF